MADAVVEPAAEAVHDTLQLALHAIALHNEKVHFDGTQLVARSGDVSPDVPALQPAVLVTLGCRTIATVVHNNLPNKMEAIHRGALQSLARTLGSNDYALQPAVFHGAAKASKALTFKCEPARAKAVEVGLPAALIAALERSVDLLEYVHRKEASRAGGLAGIATADTAGALAAADELLTAISSLIHGHDGCRVQAVDAGAQDTVKRAMAVLAALSGPGDVRRT